jgi:hypothetical protein
MTGAAIALGTPRPALFEGKNAGEMLGSFQPLAGTTAARLSVMSGDRPGSIRASARGSIGPRPPLW